CARHGCFAPHSVVDFQKGERQMNMDYALCHALSHHTDGLSQAFTFYDINCQYNKHFWHRVNKSLHLSIPSGMEIIPGIGLWHVHGHQDKCYVRYASTFITGAARIDGENHGDVVGTSEYYISCQREGCPLPIGKSVSITR
ncbi:uncharacterized protein F5891DRAFT_962476, partial [Suillus fuscotomentosus]